MVRSYGPASMTVVCAKYEGVTHYIYTFDEEADDSSLWFALCCLGHDKHVLVDRASTKTGEQVNCLECLGMVWFLEIKFEARFA